MRKASLISLTLIAVAVFAGNFAVAADPFSRAAEIDVTIRDNAGNFVKNAGFEVFHQVRDADGNLALGKKVASGNTGDLGRKKVKINVKPFIEEGKGNRFVFKIFAKETKADPTLFYNNVITNSSRSTKTFKLNSVKIALFDATGVSLENKKFSIYKEDVEDGECDCDRKKIISTSSGELGCRELFLSGGKYSIEIPTDGKLKYRKEFNVPSGRTVFNYHLSTLEVSFRDSFDEIITNKKFDVYRQDRNINNELILGKRVGSYNTGDFGKKDILLPPGVYAVKFSGNTKQSYQINNIEIIDSIRKAVDYKLSGLKIFYSNDSGEKKYDVLKGSLHREERDSKGRLRVGKKIKDIKIFYDEYEVFELPEGSYVLKVKDEKFHGLRVCENRESELSISRTSNRYLHRFKDNCDVIREPEPTTFIYGKKRLSSLAEEKRQAIILKQKLEDIMGKGRIGVSARNWHILVNSYIYGEYSAEEIVDTIRNGPQAVHPTISAPSWRKSGGYKKYLRRIGRIN